MKKPIVLDLLFLLTTIFLVGCISSKTIPVPLTLCPTSTAFTPTASLTLTPKPPTLTSSATPAPTATSTPGTVFPSEGVLKYQSVELLPIMPTEARPFGTLVLDGPDPFLLHFESVLRLEPINDAFSVSPDGQWLAYRSNNRQLTVESLDRQQKNTIWLDFYLYDGYWLNNQQMAFNLEKDVGGIVPVVVVSPFTGEHLRMPTDYPGFTASICGPKGTKQFGTASLVYDPTLELVVYPQMDSEPPNIVLWDIQAQKTLAKIEENGCFGNRPIWSPDGQRFVVATDQDKQKWLEEWVSVSREGQVELLTHFVDYFEEVDIGAASWSPDGHRVAFWLRTKPNLCQSEEQNQEHLAILDVDIHQVTDYCLSGETLVWSPDSHYLAMRNGYEDLSQILLVDFQQGWAAPIAGANLWPVGWLNMP